MSKLNSLESVLLEQLKDIYSAESQLIKALPKMVKKASTAELKTALSTHLKETEEQLARLDKISGIFGEKFSGKVCKAMKGLIEEGEDASDQDGEEAYVDLAIIAAAQRVEHYEISAYGTASAFAEELGLEEIVTLLETSLAEENNADESLTRVAQDNIIANLEEASEGSEETSYRGRSERSASAARHASDKRK